MKSLLSYLALLLLFLFMNPKGNNQGTKELAVFDLAKFYPKQEIILLDIAEVSYISLETKDTVLLCEYSKTVPISKDMYLMITL